MVFSDAVSLNNVLYKYMKLLLANLATLADTLKNNKSKITTPMYSI